MQNSKGGQGPKRPLRLTQRYEGLSLKKKILFWIFVNAILLLMSEVTVRITLFIATNNDYYLLYGKYDRKWGPQYREFLEPRNGYYKFRPNRTLELGTSERRYHVRINNHGFRGKDFDSQKPRGIFRIVTLGESSTFGFYSSDPFTYPAQLESRLNNDRTCQKQVEVINGGMPWITSDKIVALTKAEILAYKPDVLTLYAGHNDAVDDRGSEIRNARLGWNPLRWWSRRTMVIRELTYYPRDRVLVLHFLAEYIKKLLNYRMSLERGKAIHNYLQLVDLDTVQEEIQSVAGTFGENIERIIRLAQLAGAKPILITQAFSLWPIYADVRDFLGSAAVSDEEVVFYPYEMTYQRIKTKLLKTGHIYDFELRMLKQFETTKVLRTLAERYSIPLVDFIPYVDEEPNLLASYVHLTEQGNMRLAEVLQKELMKLGVGCE